MPNVSREVEKRAKCPLFTGAEVHFSTVFLCGAVGLASVAPGVRWPPFARGGYAPPSEGSGGSPGGGGGGRLSPPHWLQFCPPSNVVADSSATILKNKRRTYPPLGLRLPPFC